MHFQAARGHNWANNTVARRKKILKTEMATVLGDKNHNNLCNAVL